MIVVDASAVGTFLIPDEDSDFSTFARDICGAEAMTAPAHWPVEVANLIHKANRRGRLTDEQAAMAAAVATGVAAAIDIAATPSIERLTLQSKTLNLTAYDTAYYLLARTLGAPLLTDDGALRRVALADGIKVLTP